ncbi:RICIN domain-containing protein [Actinomadura chibensis]|uniref:RICIN domain-containing protein n=1 Tax=Actinomadura chibensis TaxID=392828 RepID=UPI0014718D0F|nr:ricin-type beta-trefoil lectin domain protein [Actinomadura chibensis]
MSRCSPGSGTDGEPIAGGQAGCAGSSSDQAARGALVTLFPCHGGANQRWSQDGGMLRSDLPGHRCLDLRSGHVCNGGAINLYDCNGARGQQWTFNGNALVNGIENTCLTILVGNLRAGTAVVTVQCEGALSQQWELA